MKIINSINALTSRLSSDILNHEKESDNDLESFSIEQLKNEVGNLFQYFDSENNYVPDYYGCGLVSRCISLVAAQKGVKLTWELFKDLGVKKTEDCIFLANQNFY